MEQRLTTSEKVFIALKERGSTKRWLAKEMQMTAPTLYSRLEHNDWSIAEIMLLNHLLKLS